MALSPDERFVCFQVSFFHSFVEYDFEQDRVTRVAQLPARQLDGLCLPQRLEFVRHRASSRLRLKDEMATVSCDKRPRPDRS